MKIYRLQISIEGRKVIVQMPATHKALARFWTREVLAQEYPGIPYKITNTKLHKVLINTR